MKKILIIALALAMTVCLLASCTPGKGGDTTAADTTDGVTNPDGFEDVTAPPKGEDKEETTKAEETTEAEDSKVTVHNADEAIARAREWLGESDPDTGYKYAFSYDGSGFGDDNLPLFRIRVSWYIEEEERYSRCGILLVSINGEVTKFGW